MAAAVHKSEANRSVVAGIVRGRDGAIGGGYARVHGKAMGERYRAKADPEKRASRSPLTGRHGDFLTRSSGLRSGTVGRMQRYGSADKPGTATSPVPRRTQVREPCSSGPWAQLLHPTGIRTVGRVGRMPRPGIWHYLVRMALR